MVKRRVAIFVNVAIAYGRDTLLGISRYIRTHEPWLIFGDPDRSATPMGDANEWDGDGVIGQISGPHNHDLLRRPGLPVINVHDHTADWGAASVLPDNIAIGRMGARHLLERGFRHFGFCGFQGHGYSQWRALGFATEVQRERCQISQFDGEGMQTTPERWNEVKADMTAWVRSLPRPVGVMCCNDTRARHLAQICQDVGVRVPEDMALLGVDNDVLTCGMSNPPLSSVDLSAEQMGYEAAAVLDRLMAGGGRPTAPILIPPTGVVTRHSSDVLAISDPTVAQAVRFIYEHAGEPIGVDDVVNAVPASRRVLERRFRTILNHTIGEQIGNARIDRAKELLVHSDVPTPVVALRSGFRYVQQFNMMFKRFTGVTPVAYRRQFHMR